MLTEYQQKTRLLLHDESFAKYNDFNIRMWVNEARGQVAGEAECVRVYATLAATSATQQYQFSSIVFPTGTTGVQGPLSVRMITYAIPGVTGGNGRVAAREWEWFNTFVLSQSAPVPGRPSVWAQFGQGASGTVFVNLLDGPYTLNLDTVCYPASLTNDASPEALPYQWTDAVPYYAAYLGYMYAQDSQRADGLYKLYEAFMQRARRTATPSVLPHQYEQTVDPVVLARMKATAA